MEVAAFADLQAEFLRRVTAAVYCSAATVDAHNRPRSRVLHPIWEGSTGWVITSPHSHKAVHLRANPYISLTYLADSRQPVYVDCAAAWVTAADEQQRIWDLHRQTPAPLGFDPQPHYQSIAHPLFGLLRFTPWRLELGNLGGEPLIWRAAP